MYTEFSYLKIETNGTYVPWILINPVFWNITPTKSIPIRPGKLIIRNTHPPKFAAIQSKAISNNWPPGAASLPTTQYTTPHTNNPRRNRDITRAICRYVGQNGYGQILCQNDGSQPGPVSFCRHFVHKRNHQDLEQRVKHKYKYTNRSTCNF